jgi:hypothetical protein
VKGLRGNPEGGEGFTEGNPEGGEGFTEGNPEGGEGVTEGNPEGGEGFTEGNPEGGEGFTEGMRARNVSLGDTLEHALFSLGYYPIQSRASPYSV